MKVGNTIQKAFNEQIREELASAYIYLAMSAYFESTDLAGAASWMRLQAREEIEHGMKFFDFLNRRGGRVQLAAIAKPEESWGSPAAAFEAAYHHEQHITERINALVGLARKEEDTAAEKFLDWFISEQVEEEWQTLEVVNRFKMVGDSAQGLFLVDRELAQRASR